MGCGVCDALKYTRLSCVHRSCHRDMGKGSGSANQAAKCRKTSCGVCRLSTWRGGGKLSIIDVFDSVPIDDRCPYWKNGQGAHLRATIPRLAACTHANRATAAATATRIGSRTPSSRPTPGYEGRWYTSSWMSQLDASGTPAVSIQQNGCDLNDSDNSESWT